MANLTFQLKKIMRLTTSIILFSLLCSNLFGQDDKAKNYYLLTINDSKYLVEEGKEFQLTSSFDKPIISITEASLQYFKNSFMEFYYPSNLTLTTKNDFGYNQWLLKDGKFTCSIHSFENEISGDAASERILGLNGFKVDSEYVNEITLGDVKVKGKQFYNKEGKMIEIYRLPSNLSTGRFIMFNAPQGDQMKKRSHGSFFINS